MENTIGALMLVPVSIGVLLLASIGSAGCARKHRGSPTGSCQHVYWWHNMYILIRGLDRNTIAGLMLFQGMHTLISLLGTPPLVLMDVLVCKLLLLLVNP
jgi:hypothetical protein